MFPLLTCLMILTSLTAYKEEINNVLGMAKDDTIIFFRLFKWFFSEVN